MVFGENVEYQIDNGQDDVESTVASTKKDLNFLKTSVENQSLGEAEKLPQQEIDNIVNYYTNFGNSVDFFQVYARADSNFLSEKGSEARKTQVINLLKDLNQKGLTNIKPDISTGNSAQAWLRAMTILNQLPENVLRDINNKIKCDVLAVKEKDDIGTYRFASLNASVGGKIIPNIEKIQQPIPENHEDVQIIENIETDNTVEEENLIVPPQEYNQFESWEELKKPLTLPVLFKIKIENKQGKEERRYFFKQTQYRLQDGKILIKDYPWRGTNEANFNHTLKVNSRAVDITRTIDPTIKQKLIIISKENSKIDSLKKRFETLNTISESNPRFVLNQFYANSTQKKQGEKYVTRAQEMEVQQKQQLLASN